MAKSSDKANIAKYAFWVAIGLAVLVSLGAWVYATSEMSGEYSARTTKLDGDFKAAAEIRSQPDFPNEEVTKAVAAEHDKLKGNVLKAWEVLYQQQQDRNKWPESLGADFLDMIKRIKPGAEIEDKYRVVYQNFIVEHLPRLRKLIDVREVAPEARAEAEKAKANVAAGTAKAEDRKALPMVGVVDWEQADWDKIERRYRSSDRLTSMQVWLSQEDLWVYEALLRVIKNTNEGYTTHYNAPVKRIDALEISQDAAAAWEKIAALKFAIEQAPSEEGESSESNQEESTEGEQTAEEGAPPPDPRLLELLDKRYVDDKGRPLAAQAKHPFAEFKMMPIHVKLSMNQKFVPKLLVQCANSNMPIEVRKMEIRSELLGVTASGAAPAATTEAGGGGGGGGAGEATAAIVRPDAAEGATTDEKDPMDVSVDLLGVIYIYNPPDLEKLGSGSATKAPAGEAEAAPAEAAPADPAAPTAPADAAATPAAAPPVDPAAAPAGAPPADPAAAPPAAAPPATPP